jgi:hypothetical protein
MKIIRINLHRLHNEEWFEFFTKFGELVSHFGQDKIGIKDLYNQFALIYQTVDYLLVVLRKSYYTKEIEAADKKRDDLFRGLHAVLKGLQRQPVAAKQEVAMRLFNLLEGYQKAVLDDNYAAESAALHNLLQDLTGSYKADVALFALTEWVTAIEQAEKEFLALDTQRTQESVDKPKGNLLQERAKADTLYTAMANVLDARLLADGLGGDVVVDPRDLDDSDHEEDVEYDHSLCGNLTYNFVIAWNETVRKYRSILAQRAGRRAKNNEPDITDEIEES